MPLDVHLYVGFLVAVLLLCAVPGPDMLFVVTNSVRHGRRGGVVAAFGVQGGMLVHTVAAVAGLSALIASSARAFDALRLVGAAYLLWLAIASLRAQGRPLVDAPDDGGGESARSLRGVAGRAALTNLLNPKIIVFFVAFVPQFVDRDLGHVALQVALLGASFMIAGLLFDVTVGLAAARAGARIARSRRVSRVLERVAAAVYVTVAARLITERR